METTADRVPVGTALLMSVSTGLHNIMRDITRYHRRHLIWKLVVYFFAHTLIRAAVPFGEVGSSGKHE